MKISLSLFCSVSLVLALFVTNVAQAQYAQSFNDYGPAGGVGYQPFSADVYYGGQPAGGYGSGVAGGGPAGYGGHASGMAGRPGRLWLRGSFADRGLGYTGHYFTVGVKSHLHEDRFDGRWLFEGRIHHSLETDGGFFSNIGLERVFSIDAADADVSFSLWYDYDGDARGDFAHSFNQIGASAQIKTPKWDLIGNGYFPVGTTDYSFGKFNDWGWDCFAGNRIIVLPGIDSALQGFDTVLRFRPAPLSMVNGTIDLGGYHYQSDLVPSFAGGKARLGLQFLQGVIVSAEVNHDDRFETTGVVSVGWLFGANASGRGLEYSRLGRDLDSVSRNDHIVRFNREAIVLMDPLTGLPYNVVHVDNLADAGVADGSYERPFTTLLDGEAGSSTFDVIAVHVGDGTDRNMDQGIVLKDYQRLWGTGTEYLVPSADGTFFELCGSGGILPTISNSGGFAVVTLANFNDVAGLNIDATGATHGVYGFAVNGGSVRENEIRNANSDGVHINNSGGDWLFENNLAENNAGSGIALQNIFDGTSNIRFNNNTASNNLIDGIRVQNTALESLEFYGNTTNENLRHGLHVNNFTNLGLDPLMIVNHTAEDNANRGIMLDTGTGPIRVFNATATGNTEAGLTIRNWHHAGPGQRIIISSRDGGESDFSGNGALGNIEFLLDQPGIRTNALVTGIRSDNGVRGVFGRADGIGTILNIDIIDNASLSGNINDGIRLMALNSGTVNANIGSTHTNFAQDILGNALGGGAGIALIAQGNGGGPESVMNAVVNNVRINNGHNVVPTPGPTVIVVDTIGVEVRSLENALSNVQILNSEIGAPNTIGPMDGLETQIGILAEFDNDGHNLINRLTMDNLTMFNEVGLAAFTGSDTYSDIILANSVLRPSGIQSDGSRGDNTPFLDNRGETGVFIQAFGQADFSGQLNRTDRPDIDPLYSPFEIISDGILDNLTRVTLLNNDISDFHDNGVEINTFGDAQMLLNMVGNTVANNGAGYNSDNDNDNVYGEQAADDTTVDINNLSFFDGVRIHAYDQSTLSANIFQNTFRDNFERGLRINTFSRAIINASLRNNVFFGNDRGEDVNNTVPDLGTGVFQNNAGLADSGVFDFEAVNNAEFYIRAHESPILLDLDGDPIDLAGNDLPADTLGFFFPGNTGSDIFGNPVADGAAQLHLSLSNNAFQLAPPDMLDFSVAPGLFTLGLDGASNGFTFVAFPGLTPVALTFADALIANETNFFAANGF